MRVPLSSRSGEPKEKIFDKAIISIASVTVMGSIMSILDTTIVNITMDTFVRVFHTSFSTAQWVAIGYLLALATVVPLTRWVVDRFGARRAWMTCVTLFVVGSALCGTAHSITELIVFRFIQGLGGGMIMPVGQTILTRAAGPDRLGRVMTVVGIPQMLGPMMGPTVGGLILSAFSWRWIFYVNLPIGILALVRAARILPKVDPDRSIGNPIDWVGLGLLPPGFALIIFGISHIGNVGKLDATDISTILGGFALLAVFVYHALHVEHPLLNIRLWKNRGLAMANTTTFLFATGMQAGIYLVPLYYQVARGDSPLHAALLMMPAGFGAMISMPNAGKIMDRSGARKIVPYGLFVVSCAIVPYTLVTSHTNEGLLAFFWFIRGLGQGCVMTPATAAGYATLSRANIPAATTINNMANRLGGSMGAAVAAMLLTRGLSGAIQHTGTFHLRALSAAQRAALAPKLAHPFGLAFWITVAFTLLAIVPALRLPQKRAADDRRAAAQQAGGERTAAEEPQSAIAVSAEHELVAD